MRIAWTIFVALHGAIHVLGFVHWSGLRRIEELGGPLLLSLPRAGQDAFAAGWLVAGLAFAAAAFLYALRHATWWMPALGAVVLSQALIVVAWHDARFGTLANAIILVAAVAAAAHAQFARQVNGEMGELLHVAEEGPGDMVTASEVETLPPPVRAWLEASGVVGRERARTVRLEQRGKLRTSPDRAWMPARAEQVFSIEPPAFVWRVDTRMFGVLPIAGRDRYAAGSGRMLIKAASLIPVVDAAGDKIDQGSMLRFLGEIVWFPSAALSPHIHWRPLDASSAEATMRDGAATASAVFTFDDRGRVIGVRAKRYFGGGSTATLETWLVNCSEWSEFQGMLVPSRGEVTWQLSAGDFTYYRWQILDIEYDAEAPLHLRIAN